MTADQKKQLSGNFAAAMKTVPKQIQLRQIRHFYLADPAYGERVANRQGIKLSEVEKAVS